MKRLDYVTPRLIEAINREESVKAAADEVGISTSFAYRIITDLGYRATLLNREEMKAIRNFRNQNTQ